VTVTARTQTQGLGGSACGSGGIMRGSAGRVYDVSASLYTFLVSARCRAASNRRYVEHIYESSVPASAGHLERPGRVIQIQ
jgi:hypothetical protein